jgi:hypothetical protein
MSFLINEIQLQSPTQTRNSCFYRTYRSAERSQFAIELFPECTRTHVRSLLGATSMSSIHAGRGKSGHVGMSPSTTQP